MQLCGFAYSIFIAASGGESVIRHGERCGGPCYQRLEIIPNTCECASNGNVEDVGRLVRSLSLNFTRAVVCLTEQSIITISNLSKAFVYSESSLLTKWSFLVLPL